MTSFTLADSTDMTRYMEAEAGRKAPGIRWNTVYIEFNKRGFILLMLGGVVGALISITLAHTISWGSLYGGVVLGFVVVAGAGMITSDILRGLAARSPRWVSYSVLEFWPKYQPIQHILNKKIVEIRQEEPAMEFEVKVLKTGRDDKGQGYIFIGRVPWRNPQVLLILDEEAREIPLPT